MKLDIFVDVEQSELKETHEYYANRKYARLELRFWCI